MTSWISRTLVTAAAAALILTTLSRAAAPTTAKSPDQAATLAQSVADKAFAYLKTRQNPDFGWQGPNEPIGMTALVLRAFMSDPKFDSEQAFLNKGFDKLQSYQMENGGIYKDSLAAYNTAIAISAFAASKDDEYKPTIAKALAYLRTLQWSDRIEGTSPLKVTQKDSRDGGFGYGSHERPDLSNTQMVLEAMHDAGMKSDDPAYQEALRFLSRCQNHSESNDLPWSGDDGGFVYSAAENGMSPAGDYTGPGGKHMLRSYGSMTYAGLKSMIYAGLSHDDPRVKAAFDWISKNYSMDENPGLGQGGLYYYYYTMARALSAYGQPIITDAQGNQHDWRLDLINKVASLQKLDGSFVGDRKWMEDNPVLATAYMAITIEEAKKDLKDHPAK